MALMDSSDVSTSDGPLGAMLDPDIKKRLAADDANQETLRAKATALPKTISDLRAKEKTDTDALISKQHDLNADEMHIYQGKPPQTQSTSMAEEWGSPAMIFAMLGSLFTRMPMTSALNAGAKVMQAYQSRDKEAADTAYKQWKESNDTALKLNQIQSNAYEKAIERIRSGTNDEIRDGESELRALSTAFGDKSLRTLLDANRREEALQLIDTRRDLIAKMHGASGELEYQKQLHDRALEIGQKMTDAKKSGDQEAIAAAQKEADELKQDIDEWSSSRATSRSAGGKKPGETGVQATKNEQITEARDAITKLKHGEKVTFGGYEITPEEFQGTESGISTGLLGTATDKQKAIAKMRGLAGSPITRGTVVEPVPQGLEAPPPTEPSPASPTPAPAPAAAAPQPVPVPPAYANDPDGTKLTKDGVTWVKRGDKLVPEEQVAPAPAGM